MDFLKDLEALSSVKPAESTSGALKKGKYTGLITKAYVEKHDKFGPLAQLELTVDDTGGRKVWNSYYFTGDYAEENMGRLKSEVLKAEVQLWNDPMDIPKVLQNLRDKKLHVYVGVKKNGKNYFSIEKPLTTDETSVLDDLNDLPSFDADEDIPV